MNRSEQSLTSTAPAKRTRSLDRRLSLAAAGLSLAAALAACSSSESNDTPPSAAASSEASAQSTSSAVAPTDSQSSSVETSSTTPLPIRHVTAETTEKWCGDVEMVKPVAPLFPNSKSLSCTSRETGINFQSNPILDQPNRSVTVSESLATLDTIGATYPGYTCDETTCSRKDTGDVGVYIQAPDGLTVGATFHDLGEKPGNEQREYDALTALVRRALELA